MISWLMDRLSDRVNHGYWYAPDPHSITNNHYGQWGQPEPKEGNCMALVNHPYVYNNTSAAQVNSCVGTGNAIGGVTMPFAAQGAAYPIGSILTIAFTDARGIVWALDVDHGYVNAMVQISQAHQMKTMSHQQGQTFITKSHPPMIEGDFTEGEMELAETIIAELKGGNDKRYNKDIQEDIDCTA